KSVSNSKGYVDIIEGSLVTIDQAAINTMLLASPPAGLGSPPFPVPDDPSSTVTQLSAVVREGSLGITVSGTTIRFGTSASFTYVADLVMEPANDMFPSTSGVVAVGLTAPGQLAFTPTVLSPGSLALALFLEVIRGFVE